MGHSGKPSKREPAEAAPLEKLGSLPARRPFEPAQFRRGARIYYGETCDEAVRDWRARVTTCSENFALFVHAASMDVLRPALVHTVHLLL